MKRQIVYFLLSLGLAANAQKFESLRLEVDSFLSIQDTANALKSSRLLFKELRKESRYFEALQLFVETIDLAETARERFFFLNSIGQIYIDMTDYDSAMIYYNQLLVESEIADDRRYQGFALNNIGYIYYQNDQYEKALDYHEMALAVRLADNDIKRVGISYNNIGLLFYHMDSLEKAHDYYTLAGEMFQEANYPQGKANTLNNIGNVYLKKGAHEQALKYHMMALEMRKQNEDIRGIAESYKNLASVYTVTGYFKMAKQSIAKGISVAEEIGSSHLLKALYLQSYELAIEQSDNKKALKQYIRYAELRDSLFSLESRNRIAELEIQYETGKRNQKIELLNSENKRKQEKLNNRSLLLIISGLSILLLVFTFLLFIRQNKLKSQLKIEQQKQRLLRSQMNPHFMYNALSAIQNFILQNNPMDSVGYISDFSGLMRLVLEGSRSDMVSISDDIKLVESYLKLQQLRFDNNFQYSVQVEDNIDTESLKIPPMLSQPFIENAVEHGMRNRQDAEGFIEVVYAKSGDTTEIQIIDNGPGIKNTMNNKSNNHSSLATKITRERLDNIRKIQGINIKIHIRSEHGLGTKIVFLIPQKIK